MGQRGGTTWKQNALAEEAAEKLWFLKGTDFSPFLTD